jgi:hypothetical protein
VRQLSPRDGFAGGRIHDADEHDGQKFSFERLTKRKIILSPLSLSQRQGQYDR